MYETFYAHTPAIPTTHVNQHSYFEEDSDEDGMPQLIAINDNASSEIINGNETIIVEDENEDSDEDDENEDSDEDDTDENNSDSDSENNEYEMHEGRCQFR
jgi:hypothetical protein